MRRFLLASILTAAQVVTIGCGRSASGGRVGDSGTDLSVGGPDGIADLRLQGEDVATRDAAVPDAVGTDVADLGRADLAWDALMPPPPDVAELEALKPPPDSRDGNVDSSVVDVGLIDARDAAPEAAAPDVASVDAPTTTNEIARACAMAASCSGYGSPMSASRCIQELGTTASRRDDTGPNRLMKCWRTSMSSGAWSCGAFRQCWGGDLFTLDSIVLGGSCSGKQVVLTPSGATSPLTLDCGALGQECVDPMTDLPRAGCTVPGCLASPIAAPSCDSNVAGACGSYGLRSTLDCARSGRTCQVSGQNAVCVGTGAACDTSDKVTCSGSEATYCAGGLRATVDCATTTVATRCAAGASSSEPCTTASTACNPSTFVDVCNGSGMQVCVDGSVATVPCSSIGLVSCSTPSGTSYARCQGGT